MENKLQLSNIMVIFGGTGDLTHRKIMPAIYSLYKKENLPDDFAVVSIGRRDFTNDEYRENVKNNINEFSSGTVEESVWEKLKSRIFYMKFNFSDCEGYEKLDKVLKDLDSKYDTKGNRIYYLAVSPDYFALIVDNLHINHMDDNTVGYKRIVIEKPFGKDLKSAEYLNNKITDAFTEKNIYRIDHYLGKEMIQNIMVLRFSNFIFEPLWNNKYIDNIQIISNETMGVENRGAYYENSGALKDMIQNHMLQLLTLTTMEPPVALETEAIRDEKVKVLRSIKNVDFDYAKKNIVRAQYGRGEINGNEVIAYNEEARVSPNSNTETFVALKLYIENFRWSGVPIYIKSGKRLKEKSTQIVIKFKNYPGILYSKEKSNLPTNTLVIKVQPTEGIYFQINAKEPGTQNNIVPVQMDYCQSCLFEGNSPEAYEKLLLDVVNGDSTMFTRWDEVEYSWKFVDNIMEIWKNENAEILKYVSGSDGPKEADDLLYKDGRKWIELQP